MKSWIRGLGLVLSSILTAYHSADAQPSGETMNPVTAPSGSSDNLDEIVVHGIRRGDLISPPPSSPTRLTGSISA
jgi:hypothetical protein